MPKASKLSAPSSEGLFSDLRSFSKQRNRKQALVRYVIMVVIGLLIAFLLWIILWTVLALMGHELTKIQSIAFTFGTILAPIMVLVCGFFILKEKKLFTRYLIVWLLVVGGLTYLRGIILGLLPIAACTIMKNGKKKQIKKGFK